MGVPSKIADEVRVLVYRLADQHDYLNRDRSANQAFISNLAEMKSVGGRLKDFMPQTRVRTYIKDAILNRYAKDAHRNSRPGDFAAPIKGQMGVNVRLVGQDGDIFLYKSPQGSDYVVVSDGAYMKWETALRKGLLYIADKPFARKSGVNVHLLLALYAKKHPVPQTDINVLRRALKRCGCKVFIYGER